MPRYAWRPRNLPEDYRSIELFAIAIKIAAFTEDVVGSHPQRDSAFGDNARVAYEQLVASARRRDELATMDALEEMVRALRPFFTRPPPR